MNPECYGCDKEIKPEERTHRMRVEYERQKQIFCESCYKRLIKIKMGIPLSEKRKKT